MPSGRLMMLHLLSPVGMGQSFWWNFPRSCESQEKARRGQTAAWALIASATGRGECVSDALSDGAQGRVDAEDATR